jgi:hypothetical protein
MLFALFVAGLVSAFKGIDRDGDLVPIGGTVAAGSGAGLLIWVFRHLPLDFPLALSLPRLLVLPHGLGIGV